MLSTCGDGHLCSCTSQEGCGTQDRSALTLAQLDCCTLVILAKPHAEDHQQSGALERDRTVATMMMHTMQ